MALEDEEEENVGVDELQEAFKELFVKFKSLKKEFKNAKKFFSKEKEDLEVENESLKNEIEILKEKIQEFKEDNEILEGKLKNKNEAKIDDKMVEKFPILEKEVLVLKAPNSKLTLENDAIEKSLLTLIVKKNSNPPKPKP